MKNLHIRVSDEVYNIILKKSSCFGISMNEYIGMGIDNINSIENFKPIKQCSKCNFPLPLSFFANKKDGKFGKNSVCKLCVQKKQRTKEGHIIQLYSSQRKASKLRNYDYPNYSSNDLIKWCLSQDLFHVLYDNWVASGFDKNLSPSCDRLDDYKPYTLDNLQIVTWRENLENEWSKRKNGINRKQSKAVEQYTLYMEYIKTFPSVRAAARETGTNYGNLGQCCRNKVSHAGGYIWKYETN